MTLGTGNGSCTFNGIIQDGGPTASMALDQDGHGHAGLKRRQCLQRRHGRQRRHLAVGRQRRLPANTALTVNGGVLDLHGFSPAVDALGGNGGTVYSGSAATLTIGSAGGGGTFSGAVSGPISLAKAGAGTIALGGSNSYTGTTVVNLGTLSLTNPAALAGGGNITFGGGTLQFAAGSTGNYSNNIVNSAGAIAIAAAGASPTFAGVLDSSNSGGLIKSGSGTLTLAASNTYGGATTISGGTLRLPALGAAPGRGRGHLHLQFIQRLGNRQQRQPGHRVPGLDDQQRRYIGRHVPPRRQCPGVVCGH